MRSKTVLAISSVTMAVTGCAFLDQPENLEQIAASNQDRGALLAARGEDAFQRCTGCHVVEAGARSTAGPNLHGIVGRVAGNLDGYRYTDALAASDIVWDKESLDQYLADPSGYVPGTEMTRGTVRDDETRTAIIAYLASIGTSEGE